MLIKQYDVYNESEILNLYRSVGWTAYTQEPAALQKGFQNSLLILAAYVDTQLVGLVRLVGDGATIIFIQDLLVHPDWQRKGIGSKLLQEVFARYHKVRQIELLTDETDTSVRFYHANGMRKASEIGCCAMIKT